MSTFSQLIPPTAATTTLVIAICEDGRDISQGFLFVDKILMCEMGYPKIA